MRQSAGKADQRRFVGNPQIAARAIGGARTESGHVDVDAVRNATQMRRGDARPERMHVDALLQAFGQRTGVPVLVNTSFNLRGEPLVASPRAAIEAFFNTPLDALVIGPFLV